MSVKLNIHPLLYHITNGQEAIDLEGNSVGQCLEALVTRFPKAGPMLFRENGELVSYVDIYVNGQSAYPQELAQPVRDGDELHIILMIDGG